MKFRVYYADGATFEGDFSSINSLPKWGVVAIVQADKEHGRKIISGGDYYVYELEDDFGWVACDKESVYYYREMGYPKDLIGVMVSTKKWTRIMKAAHNDPGFKTQTALHLYESRVGLE